VARADPESHKTGFNCVSQSLAAENPQAELELVPKLYHFFIKIVILPIFIKKMKKLRKSIKHIIH